MPWVAATDALCKLAQDGVQVRILTNSLASNDVSAVHAGPDTAVDKEPYATTGQKFMVGILKWLPIDSQL